MRRALRKRRVFDFVPSYLKQQWSKDTALGDPLVAREKRRRLVDHYPLLPIVKKISEPAKSCATNATGLQSQEQVLMQNIVKCL